MYVRSSFGNGQRRKERVEMDDGIDGRSFLLIRESHRGSGLRIGTRYVDRNPKNRYATGAVAETKDDYIIM